MNFRRSRFPVWARKVSKLTFLSACVMAARSSPAFAYQFSPSSRHFSKMKRPFSRTTPLYSSPGFETIGPPPQPQPTSESSKSPPLPDTNDPYKLLGLDHSNPPKDSEALRRAYIKRAKEYHPDAVASPGVSSDDREKASTDFAKINSAYRLLREHQKRIETEYFATTLGGPAYDPPHIRRSFANGYTFDEMGRTLFESCQYSATQGESRSRKRSHYRKEAHRDPPTRGKEQPPFTYG